MSCRRLRVLPLVFCLCFSLQVLAETCPPPKTTVVKMSLNSRRNRTGHWLTQIEFTNDQNRDLLHSKETGKFLVDIEHIQTSDSCTKPGSMTIRTTISAPPTPPGPDYELFPGMGYYKMHLTATVWARARMLCAEEGTHLAIINSEAEAELIRELLARHTKFVNATDQNYAIIGFHDLDSEGQFVTVFGDQLTKVGYLKWHGVEPNRSPDNGEDCGLVHRDGTLADVVCHWELPFICEQEL